MGSYKKSALGLGIFSVLIVFFFSLGSDLDTDVSLNELEQNQYVLEPTTVPIKVTSATISPTVVDSDQSITHVDPKVSSSNDYSGLGFTFPLLQKSFGIGSTVNTLNFEDWDMGVNSINNYPRGIVEDESGGPFDGNVYTISGNTDNKIYGFNRTTNTLTTWAIPASANNDQHLVNDTGYLFFPYISGTTQKVGMLDPFLDEITLWQINSQFTNVHGFAIDRSSNILYGAWASNPAFFSLDPQTNEHKIWDVTSICPKTGSFSFHGMSIDDNGLLIANHLEALNVCTLDPGSNTVTFYNTGLDFGRSWHNAVDPRASNTGVMYVGTEQGTGKQVIQVDTESATSTVWELPGLKRVFWPQVDSNGIVWLPTMETAAGSENAGLVRLDPTTNVITEWDFGTPTAIQHIFPASDGAIWRVTEGSPGGSTNDHLVRYTEP